MNDKLALYTSQPIPGQRLPSWVRWPLRVIAYPLMLMDLLATRLTFFIMRPKYVLKGECKQSGNCCRYIHLSWPSRSKFHLFSKLYVFWQTEVLGFYFKDFDFVEDSEVTKVMGCRYLLENGRCKHYHLRPGICRNWPKLHSMRKPSILKGCGYRAELRQKAPKTKTF